MCPHTIYVSSHRSSKRAYTCVLILYMEYMCPHTNMCPHTIYVSSHRSSKRACICVLILYMEYMCPHTNICVLILYRHPRTDRASAPIHVSSYYTWNICVLIIIYVSSHYYICILAQIEQARLEMQEMCPHATTYVSSYLYVCILAQIEQARLYMCPHTIYGIYVSSY